jgi:hypothetical protein
VLCTANGATPVFVNGKGQLRVLSMGVLRNVYEQTVRVIGPNSALVLYLVITVPVHVTSSTLKEGP